MGKKKGNLEFIIIGFVILISILYLVMRKTDKVHYSIPNLKNIKIDTVSKIILTKNNKKIVLRKVGSDWTVGDNQYKTDIEKVNKIIKNASELKLTTLVSKSKNYFKYELDPERKLNVKLFNNKNLIREFDVGKVASTYDHTYVIISGDPYIYHCSGSIKRDFDKNIDDLRDKKVFVTEKNSVTEISFVSSGKEYKVRRIIEFTKKDIPSSKSGVKSDERETNWKYKEKTINNSLIESILNSLSEINCSEYIYEDVDLTLEPLYAITVEEDHKSKSTIKIFNSLKNDEDNFPAESTQTKFRFLLKKYKVENLIDSFNEIFDLKKDK